MVVWQSPEVVDSGSRPSRVWVRTLLPPSCFLQCNLF